MKRLNSFHFLYVLYYVFNRSINLLKNTVQKDIKNKTLDSWKKVDLNSLEF